MVSISARGGGEHNATGAEPWIKTNGRTGLVGRAKKKCPHFCATAKQKPRQLPPTEDQKLTQGTSTSKGNVSRCNTAAPRKKPPPLRGHLNSNRHRIRNKKIRNKIRNPAQPQPSSLNTLPRDPDRSKANRACSQAGFKIQG